MIAEAVFSIYQAFAQSKYMKDMQALVQKLNADNVKVADYIKDPRFKLFDPNKLRKADSKIDLTDPKQHRYMKEDSVENSLEFKEKEKKWLDKAENIYGKSDRDYITALLSIESSFGKNTGDYPVINALFSNYLFTERKKLYYDYIKEFCKFVKEKNIKDALGIKGSWAGASTTAQLMPDNLRKYGMDFNEDGFRLDDVQDGIGSIAKFIHENGGKENIMGVLEKWNGRKFAIAVDKHAQAIKARSMQAPPVRPPANAHQILKIPPNQNKNK